MPEITDDEMDARLQSAGARWREATPVPTLPADRGDEVEVTPTRHRPRRARTWLAAATGAALVAAAVVIGIAVTRGDNGAPRPAGQSELAGTSWVLAPPTHPGLGSYAASITRVSFTTDGRVTGSDGCNSFSGKVDIRPAQLVFGDLARTEMACPTTQPTADLVDRVFVGEVRWTITEGRLVVTKSGVGSLTYVTLPAPTISADPTDLLGVTWGLSGVEHDTANSGTGSGSSDTAAITLTFNRSAGYRVIEPCRVLSGSVRLGAGSATFSDRSAQEHSCPSGAADAGTVAAVDEVLTGDTTWSITDGTLTIVKGSTKLTFTDHPTSDQPTPNPAASALLGTTWLLADVTSPTFHQTLDTTKTKLKLTIDSRGVFGIDDGVNFHSPENEKPVPITATTIDVGQLTSTLAGCAPVGAGAQNCTRSSVVAAFFAGTIGWAVHGDHLTLTRGSTTLVYVRA